jgi:hypothetical protein
MEETGGIKTSTMRRSIVSVGIPALLIAIIIFLAKSGFLNRNPNAISFGITFDLLFTIPIVYFLLIRKTDLPKITIFLFFSIGAVVATIVLPQENQYFLHLAKMWVIPLVELLVLILIIHHIRQAIKRVKESNESFHDFFSILKNLCHEVVVPKFAADFFAVELGSIYYGFIHWKNQHLKKTNSLIIRIVVQPHY